MAVSCGTRIHNECIHIQAIKMCRGRLVSTPSVTWYAFRILYVHFTFLGAYFFFSSLDVHTRKISAHNIIHACQMFRSYCMVSPGCGTQWQWSSQPIGCCSERWNARQYVIMDTVIHGFSCNAVCMLERDRLQHRYIYCIIILIEIFWALLVLLQHNRFLLHASCSGFACVLLSCWQQSG